MILPDTFPKLRRLASHAGIYLLLLSGALVFSWPFVWMACTSVKLDRELFGETLHTLPEAPDPRPVSPYVDTGNFRDVKDPRAAVILPLIEARLDALQIPWPAELDAASARRETARGILHKLQITVPQSLWHGPLDALRPVIDSHVDHPMADETLPFVRRSLCLGSLRLDSYDIQEEEPVPGAESAADWTVAGDATRAALVSAVQDGEACGELRYDFGTGRTIRLETTVQTGFPLDRLHRIQLALRPDDTWHGLVLEVEKLGVKYRAERPLDLAGFNFLLATWQERGPDDATNKIRTWILLREVARGPEFLNDPHAIKITLVLERNTLTGAWLAKIARNYRLAFDNMPFWRYAATSLFLVILNVVGTVFSCSLVAYAFARLRWPGRSFGFALMLATMMIPPQVTMIPQFLIIRWLGWYNTLYPLWVGAFFAGAFSVFLLHQFMKGIPKDLEDAARIDGCGFWRVYWHVMLPSVKPTLAAIGIFTFLGVWNDFMGPLIYLSDQRLYPLSLGLYAFNVQSGGNMGMMMAGSLLMTAPVVAVFFFAQRFFIQGVTLTGIKG